VCEREREILKFYHLREGDVCVCERERDGEIFEILQRESEGGRERDLPFRKERERESLWGKERERDFP